MGFAVSSEALASSPTHRGVFRPTNSLHYHSSTNSGQDIGHYAEAEAFVDSMNTIMQYVFRGVPELPPRQFQTVSTNGLNGRIADNNSNAGPPLYGDQEDADFSAEGGALVTLAAVLRISTMLRELQARGTQTVSTAPAVVQAITRHRLTPKLATALSASEHAPDTSSCTICCRSFLEIVAGMTIEAKENCSDLDHSTNEGKRGKDDVATSGAATTEDILPDVLLFPCHHAFCSVCAERWLAQSDVCPNCRQSVTELIKEREAIAAVDATESKDEEMMSLFAESISSGDLNNRASIPQHSSEPQWWVDATRDDTPTDDVKAETLTKENTNRTNRNSKLSAEQPLHNRGTTAGVKISEAQEKVQNDRFRRSSESFPSVMMPPPSPFPLPLSPCIPPPVRDADAASPMIRGQRLEVRRWTANSRTVYAREVTADPQEPQQRRLSRLGDAASVAPTQEVLRQRSEAQRFSIGEDDQRGERYLKRRNSWDYD